MNAFTGPLFTSPGVSTMTQRERYRRVMHFKTADHPIHMEFGWWNEVFPLWHQQGLPASVTNWQEGNVYFGLDTDKSIPLTVNLCPEFTTEVLEEHENHRIIRNNEGIICQVFTDGSSSIPHFLKFPIETHADWERFRDERLDPHVERYLCDWEQTKAELNACDRPVNVGVGSLFGLIRDWMGFEHVCITCADAPEWIAEMMDHLTDLSLQVLDKALREVLVDAGFFWEDMAYNAGPMISPAFFREYMTPRYKQITDLCHRRGLDTIIVDCDGHARPLIDGWIAGGVNGIFPLERAGNMWPHELRETYGESLLMYGGVDKRKMAAGRAAIEDELAYLAPVVAQGGFIPHCDHLCPPDVSYADYCYYMKRKCEVFGIPKPVDYDAMLAEADASAQKG
jgi:uroporphyrinogen decarboxylase